jgi:hypothetical protein
MVVLVLSRTRQSLSRFVPKMSVAGDGLMARMRTAWFGALGMSTAVGLGLVAFVLNQGLPSIRELPLPNAPVEFGDAQREPTAPTVSLPPIRPARDRDRDSSPARAESKQPGLRTPSDAKLVEARKTEAAPAPEPTPVELPPPPPRVPDPAPQPQATSPSPVASPASPSPPPSSPSTASPKAKAPKGKGTGLGRALGQTKGKSGHGTKGRDDSGAEGKSEPPPTIPPAAQAPGPKAADHATKHAGKSDGDH